MESYFYIEHTRKTCVTNYQLLNLRTESQSTKNCAISEKKSYGSHEHRSARPVLLREENRYVLTFVNFFVNSTRWHEEGAIIHLNSTIINL